MTAENNRKYIGELWLDDKEEETFKKSYLKNLIEQCQGHTHEFDADTVDTKHYSDILDDINTATKDKLKTFKIGYTKIVNTKEDYILGFDAVQLYNPTGEDTGHVPKTLPWSSIVYDGTEGKEIPSLYEIITQLYNQTYLGDNDSTQTNKQIYDSFVLEVKDYEETIDSLNEAIGGKIKDGKLNADFVNGLRFFIYTPEEYAELKEHAEAYENGNESYEKDYKKLHSINNIFIIKTLEEIINGGYPNGVYPYNPDDNIIDKFYQFRVNTEITEDHPKETLQYKHEKTDIWEDMCLLEDFFDNTYLEEEVIRALAKKNMLEAVPNTNNYLIEDTFLKESLKHVEVNDGTQIPILDYGREKFLAGGFYNKNNTKVDVPVIRTNGFNYLNLTDLMSSILNELDAYKESNNTILAGMNTEIGNNTANITAVTNDNNQRISSLESSIGLLTQRVDALEADYNQFKTDMTTWTGVQDWTGWCNKGTPGSYGYLEVHEKLRIARLVIFQMAIYNTQPNWQCGRYVSCENPQKKWVPPISNEKYIPGHDIYIPTSNPYINVKICGKNSNTPGELHYKFGASGSESNIVDNQGSKYFTVSFKGLYRY